MTVARTAAQTAALAKLERSRIGRARRQSGAAFEDAIEGSCDAYQRAGEAKLERVGPLVKVLGRGRAVVTRRAPVDFFGTWKGRPAVAFDAKVMADKAATYEHDVDALHQLEWLREWESCGGLGFLLIHQRSLGVCWTVPISAFTDRGRVARRSVLVRSAERVGGISPDVFKYAGHWPMVAESTVPEIGHGAARWPFLAAALELLR